MKFPYIIFILVLLSCLYACSNRDYSSSSNYMTFDDVIFICINDFPKSYTLVDGTALGLDIIDVIGIQDIHIHNDSLLFLSTIHRDSLWVVVSLPDYNILGSFFTIGQGPNEFLHSPWVGLNARIFEIDGEIFADIHDSGRAQMVRANISETLRMNTPRISILEDSFSHNVFSIIALDSNKFVYREISNDLTAQFRFIKYNDSIITTPVLTSLNRARISPVSNINILSVVKRKNPYNNRFVEMPVLLNYLNIYTLDGSYAKTICVGNRLDNIGRVQNKRFEDQVQTFAGLRVFRDFFGVVLINETMKSLDTGRRNLPSILLFDWYGNPLAKLSLPRFITSFDIDFRHGNLYTFDFHTDEFYRYDIGDILMEIQYSANLLTIR